MPVTGQLLIPLSDGVDTSEIEHIEKFESVAERIRNIGTAVDDHVPSMTAANAPTPWVISDNSWTVPAWNLFKATADRAYMTWNSGPAWVKVDCGSGNEKVVNKYSISAHTSVLRTPKDWTIQASTTGAFSGEQVTLDTRAGYTNWSAFEKKSFTFSNSIAYRYYRIYITQYNGDTYIDLSQLEFGGGNYPASASPAAAWRYVGPAGSKVKFKRARLAGYRSGSIVNDPANTDVKFQHAQDGGGASGTWLTQTGFRAVSDITIASEPEAAQVITSITRSGNTATATKTAHGYVTGDCIIHAGATQEEYNGPVPIIKLTNDTYTFPVPDAPATPATGTITASRANQFKILSQLNSDTTYEVKTPMFMVVDVEYPAGSGGGGLQIINGGLIHV